MRIKIIQIKWSYPVDYDKALEHKLSSEIGLYQISRVFGENETLLYIGIVKSKNRSFKKRLLEHKRDWLKEYRGKIRVRFGIIERKRGLSITPELIENAESLLIYEVEPLENGRKINSYSLNQELEIKNIGYRGSLPKIVNSTNHL